MEVNCKMIAKGCFVGPNSLILEGAFNLWANKPKTTPRPSRSCVQNWRNYEQG